MQYLNLSEFTTSRRFCETKPLCPLSVVSRPLSLAKRRARSTRDEARCGSPAGVTRGRISEHFRRGLFSGSSAPAGMFELRPPRAHAGRSILRTSFERGAGVRSMRQYVRSMASSGAVAPVIVGLPVESQAGPESFLERAPPLCVISLVNSRPGRPRYQLARPQV